jgi:hypothetical protein
MKRKIGDKVKVKSNLVIDRRYGSDSFVSDMAALRGKEVTIAIVNDDGYKIEKSRYNWTDEMFEDLPIIKDLSPSKTRVFTYEYLPYSININLFENDQFVKSQHQNYETEKMKVVYTGNKTIVLLSDGSKGVARCNPEDKFDDKKGLDIAFYRAWMKKIEKRLEKIVH